MVTIPSCFQITVLYYFTAAVIPVKKISRTESHFALWMNSAKYLQLTIFTQKFTGFKSTEISHLTYQIWHDELSWYRHQMSFVL